MTSGLFDRTVSGLGAALNLRLLKQNVHASNLANVNTPEYKAKKVDFESALYEAIDPHGANRLAGDQSGHLRSGKVPIEGVEPDIYDDPDGEINESGNTVNLEREMAQATQNRILYNATVAMLKKKLGQLKYVISESSR